MVSVEEIKDTLSYIARALDSYGIEYEMTVNEKIGGYIVEFKAHKEIFSIRMSKYFRNVMDHVYLNAARSNTLRIDIDSTNVSVRCGNSRMWMHTRMIDDIETTEVIVEFLDTHCEPPYGCEYLCSLEYDYRFVLPEGTYLEIVADLGTHWIEEV